MKIIYFNWLKIKLKSKISVLPVIFVLFLLSFHPIDLFSQMLYPVVVNGDVAYINNQGTIVINTELETPFEKGKIEVFGKKYPTYLFPDYAYFSEGKATFMKTWGWWIIRLGKEYGVMDSTSKIIIKPQDNIIWQFKNNIAKTIIQLKSFEYTYGEEFTYIYPDGKFCFIKKFSSSENERLGQGHYLFIEGKDTMMINTYIYGGDFSDGCALVLYKEKTNNSLVDMFNYIDTKGELISDKGFDDARHFSEGKGVVKIDSLWGVINSKGESIIKPKYHMLWEFKNGFARFFDGKLFGYINEKGEQKFNTMFISANDFSNGFAQIQSNYNEYNFIDVNGNLLSKKNFTACGNFSNGLAPIMVDGKWGFLNERGEIGINPEYDFAQEYRDGFAQVWKDDKLIIINTNGEKIWVYDFE